MWLSELAPPPLLLGVPVIPTQQEDKGQCLRVLHIDDNPFELERVQTALQHYPLNGLFAVESVMNADEFVTGLHAHPAPDILLLDVHLEDAPEGGMALAAEARLVLPEAVILMFSNMDDVSTISRCLSSGADDFLSKRSDKGELALRIRNSHRLVQHCRGRAGVPRTVRQPRRMPPCVGLTMERLAQRIPLIIDSAVSSIHISGESGTGKEVVAELFAAHLPPDVPFINVNCGAIPPSLLEAELFGSSRGAYTGATKDRIGLLGAASGGWLFLDEVGCLSRAAQAALLRALENQEVTRLGETQARTLSLRIISATNESLTQQVQRGEFRMDLWQRLCETVLFLPPLRERPDEIEPLIQSFCEDMLGGPYRIADTAVEILKRVSWKNGNVRELRNCLRAMTEFQLDKLLTPLGIPERIWTQLDSPQESGRIQHSAPTAECRPSARLGQFEEHRYSVTAPAGTSFDDLCLSLLASLVADKLKNDPKISLRKLASAVGMSRSTLTAKLKHLAHSHVSSVPALARLIRDAGRSSGDEP